MEKQTVLLRRAAYASGAFALLCVVGMLGFAAILGESLFDALYRTIITVYTAGLVAAPETTGGKAFTIFLVVWGVAIFLYVFGLVIELSVSGAVGGAWQERRTRKRVEHLRNHYIICGYGRVGRRVGDELNESGARYVVVDYNPDAVAEARRRGDLLIEGRGTDDPVLRSAGLDHAAGLVASSDSDVDNLYITLSARAARPELMIVARASTEEAAEKLALAGANRVIQPYSTAGQEMAKLMLRPQVSAFLEIVSSHSGPEFRFEEIVVTSACAKAGRTIRDLRIRHATGAVVVAKRRPDGTFETTPDPDVPLVEGDVLIAIGSEEELRALEDLFAPRTPVAS